MRSTYGVVVVVVVVDLCAVVRIHMYLFSTYYINIDGDERAKDQGLGSRGEKFCKQAQLKSAIIFSKRNGINIKAEPLHN